MILDDSDPLDEPPPGPWRRIIVTGCRRWNCTDIAERVVKGILARHDNTFTIVHGGATGVDAAFAKVCERLGVAHEPHPARWDDLDTPGALIRVALDGHRYVANAGPIRNQEMVDAGALYAVAVHRSLAYSRGTGDMVRRCLAAGIDVYLIDGVNPTRRIREIPTR